MFSRALQALGKMAPIAGNGHGTFMAMRTRRQKMRTSADQEIPRAIDHFETRRSAGFDDHQKLARRIPRLAQGDLKVGGGELART